MARLDKMLIQGIRSFGPEEKDSQRIKFQSPLTLILGQNGCGKTTIIESLKFALTGDMPPGSRLGQLFLHDPKISRKVETHARVQLQFSDLAGDSLLITRLMQLTQKAKDKLKFETRDTTLSKVKTNTGKRGDLSGRCADVDMEVCAALGISKSILNSVIFCHQEESTWPLDEGKKVKERFDDIFDATKHNKYLELIRTKKKGINEELKRLNIEIEHLKNLKDEVANKRKQLQDAEHRMTVNRDQIEKYNKKLEPIIERLDKISLREKDIMKIYTEKEKKKTELENVRANQQELEQNIQEKFKGTTRELKEFIESFQNEMKEKEKNHNDLNFKLCRLNAEDKKLHDEITHEKVKKGKLHLETVQQQDRINFRNRKLKNLAEDMGITASVSYSQASEDEIASALNQVNRKMNQYEASLNELKVEFEKDDQEWQNKIDNYRDDKVSLEQQMAIKTKQIQETKNEVKRVKEEINEVETSANKLVRIEAKLDRIVRDLEQVSKSVNVEELSEEIRQATEKRYCLEEQLEVVDKEVDLLHQQSSIQAELDGKRENKTSKEADIRKLKSKNEDTLIHLLKAIPEEGIKYELKLCMDRKTGEIKNLNSTLASKQRELTTLETTRKHQRELLRKQEDNLRAKEEMMYEVCDDREYDEVVERLHVSVQELQDQKGTLSSSEYMFRRYIQKLQQTEPCCPLCHRGFDMESDVKELINELNCKVREVPSQLRENGKKLEIEQKKYTKVLELKPTYESITTLKNTELPNLRKELEQTEKKLNNLKREVEDISSSLMEPQADLEMAINIQSDVGLIDQHCTELQKFQREIERLEAKLPPGSSLKNMQQALAEQKEMRSEITMTQRALESAQKKLTNHKERLQKLREEKNQLTEERLKIEGGVQQRKQLEDKQSELQGVEALLAEEVDGLRKKLGESRKVLEIAIKEKNEAKQKNGEKLKEENKQISEFQKRVEEIQRYHKHIKEFEQQGINKKLSNIEEHLNNLELKKDNMVVTIQDINLKIGDINNDLSKQQIKKRDLDDNLKLRSKEEDAVTLTKQIEEIEKSLGDLKVETLGTEKRRLRAEEESITRERSEAQGRLKEQQETIVILRNELKKPLFKNAEKDYLEKVVRKKVGEAAESDLFRYYKATEWAMFYFHTERMREINGIIRELWRQIYRGNDIDYIEIKTEAPEQTSSDRRRNYNYRVVQMKNDVEIDMRGRCSAGQKVLASLIIRMALAETFSANCGMLALDEPTTNLDRENIESLSTALADIVNSRMTQKNFQLIIITHDEEFLDRLSKVEKLESYYRVSRNEHGKSIIEKYRVDR